MISRSAPDVGHELADVGIVRTEHGELEALLVGSVLVHVHDDARERAPDPEPHLVLQSVRS